jgi:hypothetical protein
MTAQQPEHCEHECVCPDWRASHSDEDEDPEPCTISCMQRMTLPHTRAPEEVVYRCCEYYEAPRLGKPEECRMATEATRAAMLAENSRCIKILQDYKEGLDYPNCPPGDTIGKLIGSLRQSTTAAQEPHP